MKKQNKKANRRNQSEEIEQKKGTEKIK